MNINLPPTKTLVAIGIIGVIAMICAAMALSLWDSARYYRPEWIQTGIERSTEMPAD